MKAKKYASSLFYYFWTLFTKSWLGWILKARTNKQEILTSDHQGCFPFSECELPYSKIRSQYTLLIIGYMLIGRPIMQSLICSLDLVSKFWLKQNLFDKKDFDCNDYPIYPTYFCWLLPFFLLATIRYKSNKHLIQFFIFIFTCKTSCFSLQSQPHVILFTSFQAKWRIQLSYLKFT